MPRTPTACNEPGCPELTLDRKCERHRLEARRASDARRPSSLARGYDGAWRRTRKRFLRAHPTCEWCGAPATQVDHRDGLGPRGPHGHDPLNLRALCGRCHSRRTARDQPGGWHTRHS